MNTIPVKPVLPESIVLFDGMYRANSANYIMRKGEYIEYNDPLVEHVRGWSSELHIDIEDGSDNSRALKTAIDKTIARLQQDSEVAELLNKKSWNLADRELYEEKASYYLSQHISDYPQFDSYNLGPEFKVQKNFSDIDPQSQLVCTDMSIMESIGMQHVDNALLPATSSNSQDYKIRADYYVVSGEVSHSTRDHAWVMSDITGNVIEATVTGELQPYHRSKDPNHNFISFIAGEPFVNHQGKAYHSNYDGHDPAQREKMTKRKTAIEQATLAGDDNGLGLKLRVTNSAIFANLPGGSMFEDVADNITNADDKGNIYADYVAGLNYSQQRRTQIDDAINNNAFRSDMMEILDNARHPQDIVMALRQYYQDSPLVTSMGEQEFMQQVQQFLMLETDCDISLATINHNDVDIIKEAYELRMLQLGILTQDQILPDISMKQSELGL